MRNVYQCRLCDALVMAQGVQGHMNRSHPGMRSYGKYEKLQYHLSGMKADLRDYIDPKTRKIVLKWVFSVKGKFGTEFHRGDEKKFRLWIYERVRYVNDKYGAGVRVPTYLEDYFA